MDHKVAKFMIDNQGKIETLYSYGVEVGSGLCTANARECSKCPFYNSKRNFDVGPCMINEFLARLEKILFDDYKSKKETADVIFKKIREAKK